MKSLPWHVFSFKSGFTHHWGLRRPIYTGQLYQKNLSDADFTPDWQITGVEYQTGGMSVDLLPDNTSGPLMGVVDPYYPTLTVPDEILWKCGNATNGTRSPADSSHTYSANNVPTGDITVTLANGLRTTIPSQPCSTLQRMTMGSCHLPATVQTAQSTHCFSRGKSSEYLTERLRTTCTAQSLVFPTPQWCT